MNFLVCNVVDSLNKSCDDIDKNFKIIIISHSNDIKILSNNILDKNLLCTL